jgi:protein transport protein HofC
MTNPETTPILLSLVGLAVLVSARLVYRNVRPLDDQVHLGLRTMGWGLIALGALVAVELFVGIVFGPLFWLAGILVIGIMAYRCRSAEQNALVELVAIAAEKQLPLAPCAEAFATEWGGTFGHRAKALATLLKTGLPLADCLERERGAAPPAVVLAARVGTEAGALGPALREAAESRTFQEPLWHAITAKAYYLFCVLFAAQAVTVYMLLQVIPKIQAIFGGFNLEMPAAAEWMASAAESTAVLQATIALLVLELLVLTYLTAHFLGVVTWSVPGLNRLARRLDTAQLLRALAWAVDRRLPLDQMVRLLADWYPKWWIRRKLIAVHRDMQLGEPWREALADRGLIGSADAAVLAAAERVGNLPWALREMAASSERRLAYRLQVLAQWLYPLVIAWLGLLVFVFVSAYFLPLIKVLEQAGQ